MNITEPLNSNVSGIPSRLNRAESVFQHSFLFLLESKAAFNKFKLVSSYSTVSQSSSTNTFDLSALL